MEAQAAPAVPATQGFLRLSGWELDGERQPVSEVDVVVDSYPVVIGRECRGETLPNKISVSKSFMVSRHHLKLDWDEKQGNFTLEILGKNSVTVDRTQRLLARARVCLWRERKVARGGVCVRVARRCGVQAERGRVHHTAEVALSSQVWAGVCLCAAADVRGATPGGGCSCRRRCFQAQGGGPQAQGVADGG
jgi:hypothetical protein